MRTISYAQVLQLSVEHDGLPLAKLLADDAARARTFISAALAYAWEQENFPELMRLEERWFRPRWAIGTTYAATTEEDPVEVFYSPTGKYYQSLHGANLGNAPAIAGEENAAHWAECRILYNAIDWAAGQTYAVGDQVRNNDDDKAYQCRTAHTSGGSFDATKFGLLVMFERYVAYEQPDLAPLGEVVWAGSGNKRVRTDVREYSYLLTEKGVAFTVPIKSAWLEYSIRCPVLTGEVYDETDSYDVGAQVYFAGDFYDCIDDAAAGDTPATDPDKWRVVGIPYIFRIFLAQYAYSLWLIADGQHEKAAGIRNEAVSALGREANKLWRRQHQVPRTSIQTR